MKDEDLKLIEKLTPKGKVEIIKNLIKNLEEEKQTLDDFILFWKYKLRELNGENKKGKLMEG